jgi:hypothetical protein
MLEMTESRRLERAFALSGETEILPMVSQLSPEFVLHLAGRNLLANRGILLDLAGQRILADPGSLAGRLAQAVPLPSQLYTLALARQRWSRFRSDIFLDRPTILSSHVYFRQDPRGSIVRGYSFDIVTNDVAVHTGSGQRPFAVRLEQGIIDTNVEAMLLPPGGGSGNAAELFAASRGQRVEWVALRTPRDPSWQGVGLPNDIRARIEEDLAAGYVVLVPRKPIRLDDRASVGWWRVDPETGQTLGIGDRGWGQGGSEQTLTTGQTVLAIIGVILLCLALAAGDGSISDVDGVVCGLSVVGGGLIVTGKKALAALVRITLGNG